MDDNNNKTRASLRRTNSHRRFSGINTTQTKISTNDLPYEPSPNGMYTPGGLFLMAIQWTAPLAYLYIILILWSDFCCKFPEFWIVKNVFFRIYKIEYLVKKIHYEKTTPFLDTWAIVEAVFYILQWAKLQYLNYCICPLETSLSSAPLLDFNERQTLWDRMMECEKEDPSSFVTGWFFDESLGSISSFDIHDFICWSTFDGRNQEHLSLEETKQLELFVLELEWRISIQLYGYKQDYYNININTKKKRINHTEFHTEKKQSYFQSTSEDHNNENIIQVEDVTLTNDDETCGEKENEELRNSMELFGKELPTPKQMFRFHSNTDDSRNDINSSSIFSNLYESYKQRYEQYRSMMIRQEQNLNKHLPVEDLRNYMATKKDQLHRKEEEIMENASFMYEQAYYSIIQEGSDVDKQLSGLSSKAKTQFFELWEKMMGNFREQEMKLKEMATYFSEKKKELQTQLEGYHRILDTHVYNHTDGNKSVNNFIPSKQMAELMRKITQCNEHLYNIEVRAKESFMNVVGGYKNSDHHISSLFQQYLGNIYSSSVATKDTPKKYYKYSYDPLLGINHYPLMFHMLMIGITEGGLRAWMKSKGFQRKHVGIGQISYYFHPGNSMDEDTVPIVFVHGIGVGLIYYLPLIDRLLKLGRPMFLPEIPYVTGFRTWLHPSAILTPGAVASTISSMLLAENFLQGATFAGHSYGTSWMSYMCKYGPSYYQDNRNISIVHSLVFIDPICFCLHIPFLTKQFVYHRPDPGAVSVCIRTDPIINFTIQRGFPWSRISLFLEEIKTNKCVVFLSEKDALVPVKRVSQYLESKGSKVYPDYRMVKKGDLSSSNNRSPPVILCRNTGHGDWIESGEMMDLMAQAVDILGKEE